MSEGSILFYGIKGDRMGKLKKLAEEMDLLLRPVGDGDMDFVVEELLERDPLAPCLVGEGSYDQDFEYLLFIDLSSKTLSHFLDRSREEDFYVGYKAGLTDINRKWKLSKLIAENQEEHHTMLMMERARQVIGYLSQQDPACLEEDLMVRVEKVGAFLQGPNPDRLTQFREDYRGLMQAFSTWLRHQQED